jgi:hypothetical protein
MDWRLIAAVTAAAGSFCVVGVGAYVVLTTSSARQQTFAPAPVLLAEHRLPAEAAPPLTGMQGTPGRPSVDPAEQTSPDQAISAASTSPFAFQDAFAPSTSAAPSVAAVAPGPVAEPAPAPLDPDQSWHGHPAPRPPARKGAETVALGHKPHDDGALREPPPRPVIEPKKTAVVPELQTALPVSRYRGVLTSAEILRIKRNLRLTPEQEPAWPAVEAALAEIGRQQIVLIRQGQEPRISSNDWPPGRLYAIAGPLLQTLRPDQKETVRRVCRSLGFENVASML